MLFPVERPGEHITDDWKLLFFLFFLLFQNIIIFVQKKKKNCGCPTGHIFGHPLDRKQTFFRGGPILLLHVLTHVKAKNTSCAQVFRPTDFAPILLF